MTLPRDQRWVASLCPTCGGQLLQQKWDYDYRWHKMSQSVTSIRVRVWEMGCVAKFFFFSALPCMRPSGKWKMKRQRTGLGHLNAGQPHHPERLHKSIHISTLVWVAHTATRGHSAIWASATTEGLAWVCGPTTAAGSHAHGLCWCQKFCGDLWFRFQLTVKSKETTFAVTSMIADIWLRKGDVITLCHKNFLFCLFWSTRNYAY